MRPSSGDVRSHFFGMHKICLNFYGVRASVSSKNEQLIGLVRHDFSYFEEQPANPDLLISWEERKPDYDILPRMKASLATPRNICFQHQGISYIDYFGQALNIYQPEKKECLIIADDIGLAHEITYLTILSRVSEILDQQGIHRIHALGLACGGRACLILLPSGGGKTTLAMQFLTSGDNDIKLISEDSPLIDSRGNLLPFPIRIGVLPDRLPGGINPRYVHRYLRMEHGPKMTINLDCFGDKVCRKPVKPGWMILGERIMSKESLLEPAHRTGILKYSLMNSVIGVGLYQGLEFMAQNSFRSSFGMFGRILSRMNNNRRLISHSRIYRFSMGRDIKKNMEIITRLIREGRD